MKLKTLKKLLSIKKDTKLYCDVCSKEIKNEPTFKVWWIFEVCQDCYNRW